MFTFQQEIITVGLLKRFLLKLKISTSYLYPECSYAYAYRQIKLTQKVMLYLEEESELNLCTCLHSLLNNISQIQGSTQGNSPHDPSRYKYAQVKN